MFKRPKYVYIAMENEYAYGNKVNNILGVFKTYERAKETTRRMVEYAVEQTGNGQVYCSEEHNDILWLMYRKEDWEEDDNSYDRIFKRYYVIQQEVLD